MGSDFVTFQQDPWYGNFATGLANSIRAAPKQALDQTMTVENIWKLREERARENEKWIAAKKLADSVDAATPEARVDPSFRDVPYQPQGPVQPDPEAPPPPPGSEPELLPATTMRESFIDPRAVATAKARRDWGIAGARASVLADPKTWAAQGAHAEVAATGAPADPRRRAELQFQATGRFPTTDESKLQGATNFTIYKNGQSTGRQYSTRDGRTTLEGQPIGSMYDPTQGEVALESGAASMAQPNPIESAPIAQHNFNQLAATIQAKAARGETITNAELNAARAMRDNGWQSEIHWDTNKETGQTLPRPFFKIPLPTTGPSAWLIDTLDHVDGRPGASRGQIGGGGTAGVTVPATTAPAAPGAAAPAPAGAPAAAAPAGDGSIGAGDPRPVVSDYMKSPVVHSYENAKTGYATFIGNVPFNNMTSDLAMIIGAAKILDPPSVVREGEVENVRKTGSVMDKFIGQLQSLKGEARLPPAVRMQLWNMVHAAMQEHNANIKPIYEQHAVQLTDRKVDYKKYLPEMLTLRPPDATYISSKSGRVDAEGRSPRGTAAAAAAPAAAAGTAGGGKPPLTPEDKAALDAKLLGGR